MPYDSEGNFYRVHNWEEDRINDIDIVADRHVRKTTTSLTV